MTQKERNEVLKKIQSEALTIMGAKSHDYAGEDILLNFKTMKVLMETLNVDMTKVEGIHMFYILLKVQRLCNLMFSGKVAKNESLQDTLIDLRNYVDLLNCTIHETKICNNMQRPEPLQPAGKVS